MKRKANLKKGAKGPMKMKMGNDVIPSKKMLGGIKKYQAGNPPGYDPKVDEYNFSPAIRGRAAEERYAQEQARKKQGEIERYRQNYLSRGSNTNPDADAANKPKPAPKPAPKPNQGSSSFNQAFAAARKAGKTTFTYNGKSYGTRRADETSEQHKAAMARVAGQSSSAPKSAPAPERLPSRPTPKPEAQLQRSTTPSVAPAAKSKPAARPAAQAPQSSSKTTDMKMKGNIKKKMGGSYLEPDKELKFGGMKYEMGGMEECGPGRPCPNARKAAKTKRNQHKNLSRGQRRYMR
jgi:hypothetical protein